MSVIPNLFCYQVRLIASVPGYHNGLNLRKWGHMKLRGVLEECIFDNEFCKSPLVYQVRDFLCADSLFCFFKCSVYRMLFGLHILIMASFWTCYICICKLMSYANPFCCLLLQACPTSSYVAERDSLSVFRSFIFKMLSFLLPILNVSLCLMPILFVAYYCKFALHLYMLQKEILSVFRNFIFKMQSWHLQFTTWNILLSLNYGFLELRL